MNYLVVGLGNIGAEYIDTRHNIGFSVLDLWAQGSNILFKSDRYGSVADVRFKGRTFTLLKPSTYMNLSGKAVDYWLKKKNIQIENLIVIVDDLALPIGSIRIRKKGSDGGHNGLSNIAQVLGTEAYPRMRLGIGGVQFFSQVDFVLGKWSEDERKHLEPVLKRAIDAVKAFGTIGLDRTMNTYNGEVPTP